MQTSASSHILIELADDVTTYFQRVVRQSAHGLAENDRRRVRLCPEHPWAIATEHIRAIICVFSILFNLYTRMLYCLLKRHKKKHLAYATITDFFVQGPSQGPFTMTRK
ncbi:unnamed protein product [Tenebrio molitor]|nr:unnamed protein product [Tenebrio molitor]